MEVLDYYHKKYFTDITQIEEMAHVPSEFMPQTEEEILIQESYMSIPMNVIQVLYPICKEVFQKHTFKDEPNLVERASFIMLFINGEDNNAWNVRFQFLKQSIEENDKDKKQKLPTFILQRELDLAKIVSRRFTSTSIPHYYRYCLLSGQDDINQNFDSEFSAFSYSYNLKNRYYQLFMYRTKYILLCSAQNRRKEVQNIQELAAKDIHNYSILHYLLIVADSLKCAEVLQKLLKWALELEDHYRQLYQFQDNKEIQYSKLESLTKFIKIIEKLTKNQNK